MHKKVLICTPLYPPDIGGPAKYAKNIFAEFQKLGHEARIFKYGAEKNLPGGVRHLVYFFKIVFGISKADLIIALDTFSVGLPAVCAAKIFGKKIVLRVGGDFLWESYVEKTGDLVTLKNFYTNLPKLSLKHRIIFSLSKFVLKNSKVAFTTGWQKEIFKKVYGLDESKIFVVENFYGEKLLGAKPKKKNFLWAGRNLKLKNLDILKSAFALVKKDNEETELEISEHVSHEALIEKIKNCYAVILPSLSEVSPNFILEAIRYGKPFVCTKETGLYEKLKDTGLFVDPLNEEDIKNKILFLADDANYAKYRERAESFNFTHSWGEIAAELSK